MERALSSLRRGSGSRLRLSRPDAPAAGALARIGPALAWDRAGRCLLDRGRAAGHSRLHHQRPAGHDDPHPRLRPPQPDLEPGAVDAPAGHHGRPGDQAPRQALRLPPQRGYPGYEPLPHSGIPAPRSERQRNHLVHRAAGHQAWLPVPRTRALQGPPRSHQRPDGRPVSGPLAPLQDRLVDRAGPRLG